MKTKSMETEIMNKRLELDHSIGWMGRACPASIFIVLAILLMIATRTPGAYAASPAKSTSAVVRATLPNGLQVAVIRNPIAPVVATVVNYRVGFNETPAGFPGMAHAQEHTRNRKIHPAPNPQSGTAPLGRGCPKPPDHL
jgi:hypothetical protein